MPFRRMFLDANKSRSFTDPHLGHAHVRSFNDNSLLTCPHSQVLEEGYHLSIWWTVTPYFVATYSSLLINDEWDKSDIFFPHRRFIASMFNVSRKMKSYFLQSSCANFHWKSLRRFLISLYVCWSSKRLLFLLLDPLTDLEILLLHFLILFCSYWHYLM